MKNIFVLILLFTSIWLNCQTQEENLFAEGVKELRNNNLLKGIELMSDYLIKYPSSANAYYNRGMAKLRMGETTASCSDINTAVERGFTANKKMIDYYCKPDFKLDLLRKEYYPNQKLVAENNYRPVYTRIDSLQGALRFERNCYDVTFYNLSVRILPATKSIIGNSQLYFLVVEETSKIQIDLAYNLPIDSICWDNKLVKFEREYNAVWVNFPEQLLKGSNQKITVYYRGIPRNAPKPPWDGGFVWKNSGPSNLFVGVACEHLGASVWWPTKDHISDRCDSMAINIEVPAKYKAVCNGRLRNIIPLDKKYTRYEWFVNYPINNYNATFYMGKYVEFTDTVYSLNDTLTCRYHVLPKHLKVAKTHFKQAKEVVDFYNRAFGPFPFWDDNYRLVESPYEGMEHQTAIAYGAAFNNEKNSNTYLCKNYDYIIVHETAHEWWGNTVTANDMADAWIHEGFATYSEYMFLEEKIGYLPAMKELQNHMLYIFNVWPLVDNRDVNENSFAGGDIYVKGAAMLNSLRSSIANDSIFFGLVRNFYLNFKNRTIETKDFIDFVKLYTGKDYSPMLSKYLFDKDIPVLEYKYLYKDGGIQFKYKWTEVQAGFEMPFALEINGKDALRLEGTTQEQTILLNNADRFLFFNQYSNLDLLPKHGFTYFNTHCLNFR